MKKILSLLILSVVFHVGAEAQEKQIEEIRRIYQETGRKIGAAEKAFAMSKKEGGIAETEIFLTEMQFNKGNTSYPAVGVFREDAKFYFTFGKKENPYPERLLKIVTLTHRSGAVERREYLFDSAGLLIFILKTPTRKIWKNRKKRGFISLAENSSVFKPAKITLQIRISEGKRKSCGKF